VRVGKVVCWSFAILLLVVLLAAAGLYVAVSWVPAEYRPARLTAGEKELVSKVFVSRAAEFYNRSQEAQPFRWEETDEQLNRYLASMDEIVADMPHRRAGEVKEVLDSAGVSDLAVAVRNGVLTVMFRSTAYNKIVSVDLGLDLTPQESLQVRLKGARVGRLPIPSSAVRESLEKIKGTLRERLSKWERTEESAPSTRPGELNRRGDIVNVLPAVLAAIDEAPFPAEIPRWRLRVRQIDLTDGRMVLHFTPLPR